MSRHLVTGATGFLGRHLVAQLVAQGHDVVALVRTPGVDLGGDVAAALAREGAGSVTRVKGDILDRASVEAAAAGCEGVFHCAGKVSRKPEDAEELHRLHVIGTRTVLDACIARGVRRAVVASTSGVVAVSAEPDKISTEDDETPIGIISRWPYYRTKLFAEQAALEKNGAVLPDNAGLFEVVCVNPTLLLGPGDVNGSSTEDVRLFLERRIPAIPPGGLSYVDVRDAATGMRLAMERGTPGKRYLLGACNLTMRELFARLERVSGVRAPVVPVPRAPHGIEVARAGAQLLERMSARLGLTLPVDAVSLDMAHHTWYLDASRAERELGWTPRDPTETLADTVADLEARGVVWPADLGATSSVMTTAGTVLSTLRRRVTNAS